LKNLPRAKKETMKKQCPTKKLAILIVEFCHAFGEKGPDKIQNDFFTQRTSPSLGACGKKNHEVNTKVSIEKV